MVVPDHVVFDTEPLIAHADDELGYDRIVADDYDDITEGSIERFREEPA